GLGFARRSDFHPETGQRQGQAWNVRFGSCLGCRVETFVFLAVLFAAACHAGWNALIKIGLDPRIPPH
ncbi:MAG TPA: hypothetical protein VID96_01215, partial [Xanthobacteraceae bacterium]